MDLWSRAQVLAAAPDDASRKAAIPLVSTSAWPESGRSGSGADEVLWGRCRGSSTYGVVVRPGATYACSCPSRKSPCKHALALLLRWVDGLVGPAELPGWAGSARPTTARETARETDPEHQPDVEAAAARAAARREKVTAGLDELERWLADQIRDGLAGWERRGWSHVEGIAARMVDAQAPGVAGTLRGLPSLLHQERWPERLVDALAALQLLVSAHRGIDRLPPDLAATVRSRVGYPVAKATVLATPPVVDRWRALGVVDSLEGRLETRRVWLWGQQSRTWALLLSFAVPGSWLDDSVAVGQVVPAALHRYPGAGEFRGLLGERLEAEPARPTGAGAAETVAQTQDRWASLVAVDPWAGRMPAVVRAIPVVSVQGAPWHLADPDGTAVPLLTGTVDPWPLLAASGGREVDVFGEWGPAGFAPLELLAQQHDDEVAPRLVAVA